MPAVSIRALNQPAHLPSKIAMTRFVEWFGATAGVIGALMLASNTTWSGYGWLAFLTSNIAWFAYAAMQGVKSMLLMQLVFAATSLIGIYRWLV